MSFEVKIAIDVVSSTILFSVPLLLVALGGMFSERSGIINIALEGIMIIGALMGCLTLSWLNSSPEFLAKVAQNPLYAQGGTLLAIVIAAIAGMLYSLLLGFASINLKADQTIGGTALNMLAPAAAIVATWAVQGQGQTTIIIPTWSRITMNTFGSPIDLENFFQRFFFKSMYLTTPIAFILLIIAIILLYKTSFGLRLRACGEHPQAADSVGINVYKMRYIGVALSGLFGGIGGLAYTFATGSGFQSTVMGYGFLALAVMIFGNWKPLNILGASFFFALFKVISAMYSSISFLPSFEGLGGSEYIYLMLPYVVTMLFLILTSKKSRAPKAEGVPYDKGSR